MSIRAFLDNVFRGEGGASMDSKVILDDGRGILRVEVGWDEESDSEVVWLFPQTKEERDREMADAKSP